jgi:hypothetical protein
VNRAIFFFPQKLRAKKTIWLPGIGKCMDSWTQIVQVFLQFVNPVDRISEFNKTEEIRK